MSKKRSQPCSCWTEWVNQPASYDENCPACQGSGIVTAKED